MALCGAITSQSKLLSPTAVTVASAKGSSLDSTERFLIVTPSLATTPNGLNMWCVTMRAPLPSIVRSFMS